MQFKRGLGLVENIVGKGESAGVQHLLFFPQCFQKLSFLESLSQDFKPCNRVKNIVGKGENAS